INGIHALTKVEPGKLILSNANTYRGKTTVSDGILSIRDSQGLGATTQGTTVEDGGTLQLEVDDPATDSNAQPTDSVTGNNTSLHVSEPLTITGLGFNSIGALDSKSGVNEYEVAISMTGTVAAIGVEADPNAAADISYFTNSYSLTLQGNLSGGQN